jgi:hypothetical protein
MEAPDSRSEPLRGHFKNLTLGFAILVKLSHDGVTRILGIDIPVSS